MVSYYKFDFACFVELLVNLKNSYKLKVFRTSKKCKSVEVYNAYDNSGSGYRVTFYEKKGVAIVRGRKNDTFFNCYNMEDLLAFFWAI